MTEQKPPYPLVLLSLDQGESFERNASIAKIVSASFLKVYPSGYGIAIPSGGNMVQERWIVSPDGAAREAPFPGRQFPMGLCENAPKPAQCPCGEFTDFRTFKPWRESEEFAKGEHSPLCQWSPHCAEVFDQADALKSAGWPDSLGTAFRDFFNVRA